MKTMKYKKVSVFIIFMLFAYPLVMAQNSVVNNDGYLVIKDGTNLNITGNFINNGAGVVQGNGANNVIKLDGDISNNGSLDISFSNIDVLLIGNTDVAISGATHAVTFEDVEVAKSVSSKVVTLNRNITVSNTLKMTLGIINSGSNVLTVGTSTSNRGTIDYTAGYVSGTLERWFTNATNTDAQGFFPMGNSLGDKFAKIAYTSAPTTGGTLKVHFNETAMGWQGANRPVIPAVGSCSGFTTSSYSDQGYWEITPNDGMSNDGNYDITFEGSGFLTITDLCQLAAVKRVGTGLWHLSGSHLENTGTIARPILKQQGATGWSNWGWVGGDPNVLPIELISFEAKCNNNDVIINWSTATEINNSHFFVERSINGIDFVSTAQVVGAGNSNSLKNYSYTDKNQPNTQVYYRITQVDFDGTSKSFNPSVVNCESVLSDIMIQPNPFKESFVIKGLSEEETTFNILDMQGRLVYKKNHIASSMELINVPYLAPGMYTLIILTINGATSQFKIAKD